ncbi:MAG: potassium channel family protein [Pseudomonadota bacterium]
MGPPDIAVLALALLLAAASILTHYEALSAINRLLGRIASPRVALLVAMGGLLIAHIVEIWLYGGAYALTTAVLNLGALEYGATTPEWYDPVYFSAMVYTTVGFGDIVPVGPMRLLVATEALVGLSLITWSASFAFLQMQKVWR